MKVLYLFLPVHPKCNTIGMRSMPPLALYYLATILEDNGIEVDIVDPSIISRSQYFDTNVEAKKFIGNLFDNKEYDAILFSATTGNWGVRVKSLVFKLLTLSYHRRILFTEIFS